MKSYNLLTSRVNSLSIASGYLSVRTAEGASEKQSSLNCAPKKWTYLLTYLLTCVVKDAAIDYI